MNTTIEYIDDETDYEAPTVKGNVYVWKHRPTFDQVLCELPDEIHVLATGQAIAVYGEVHTGPLRFNEEGKLRAHKVVGSVPPVPYEGLDELLEEHCQGCLKEDDLRAALQDQPVRDVAYSREQLEAIRDRAVKFWGEFGVNFKPRLA